MTRTDIENALAAAVDAESESGGFWWPGREMAPIAYRRWTSFGRRHPSVQETTQEERIRDLARGLQDRFEPNGLYTPFSEWLDLAKVLADVLATGLRGEPGDDAQKDS